MFRYQHLVLLIFTLLLHLWISTIDARPRTKTIVVYGHHWTVPDEPGWEEVLMEAEPIRHHLLANCASSRECREAAEYLRHIFLKHPVSAKYYDDSISGDWPSSDIGSIFKWG